MPKSLNNPHLAVMAWASRGRGRVWHFIRLEDGGKPDFSASHPPYYDYPHYISACGAAVQTLPQLIKACREDRGSFERPDTNLKPCRQCARSSGPIWRRPPAAGDREAWDAARAEMVRLLIQMSPPAPYLGTGPLGAYAGPPTTKEP